VEWLTWAQEWKVCEPILTWKKSSLSSRVGFGSIIGSKSKNLNSHSFFINGMWLSKMGDSISRSIGTGINIGSEKWSKLDKDTVVNIDLKFETKSESWGWGSHSHSSSISLNRKLVNLSKIWNWSSSS